MSLHPDRRIVFVCTGNTCRSPMAEAICRRMLATRLGCGIDDLPERGFAVSSAGVMAATGLPASGAAVAMFGELADHRSRPVSPEALAAATDVIALTRGHRAVLLGGLPGVGPPPVVLGGDADVPDPIGGGPDEYAACARQIHDCLDPIITGWLTE